MKFLVEFRYKVDERIFVNLSPNEVEMVIKLCLLFFLILSDPRLILNNTSFLHKFQLLLSEGESVKDLSINLGTIDKLAYDIQNQVMFPIEGFRNTGFYRVGNVGKYLSKNLRDYIYNGPGEVDPKDEAVVITIYFISKPEEPTYTNGNDGALTFFLHNNDVSDDVKTTNGDYLLRGKRSLK